jgi:hypothetical protein
MNEYDVTFRLAHSDKNARVDAEWLAETAEKLMDYYLDAGHDAVVSTNANTVEIELQLPAFGADSDHEAIRIASEMLATAGTAAGIKILMDRPTKRQKGQENAFSKLSTLVSA